MLPPKKNASSGVVKEKPVTSQQVDGAMAALAKKKNMSKKARAKVAAKLKGMKAGAKK